MKSIKLKVAISSILALSSIAYAQDNTNVQIVNLPDIDSKSNTDKTTQESRPTVTLDPIVITATRTPVKTSNLVAQTSVINKTELKRFQGQTVFEVIKQHPSFHNFSYGGIGATGNFFVRGYDSKQVLVLIDGVRYASLSTGSAALSQIPTEQIERIEILYGASGSSIYGADAMGGVIQIFTKPDVAYNSFSLTAGIGSHDHYTYGISGTLADKNGSHLKLSASHNETDGINATTRDNAWSFHNDKDGYENDSIGLNAKFNINDQLNFGLNGLYSKSEIEYDKGSSVEDPFSKNVNGSTSAFIEYDNQKGTVYTAEYGVSFDESESHESNISEYNTLQHQTTFSVNHKVGKGDFVYGFENVNQKLNSTKYETDDRTIKSIFTGYQLAETKYDLQANVRFDSNSDFGDSLTHNIGGSFKPTDNFRVGAAVSKGFRAPSFNDLYTPYGGNPELKAEKSNNFEVFTEFNTKNNVTRVTVYQNYLEDKINWVPNAPGSFTGTMTNIDEVDTKGVSISSDWNVNNYLFGLNYDFQKSQDSKTGNYLVLRPKDKASLYAGYQTEKFDIRAEYNRVGDYFSNASNTEAGVIDGYGLFNISGNVYLTPNLSINSRINNIFDKEYTMWNGYNTDGTNYLLSVTYDY